MYTAYKQKVMIIGITKESAYAYAERIVDNPTIKSKEYFENEECRYVLCSARAILSQRGHRPYKVYIERLIMTTDLLEAVFESVLCRVNRDKIIWFD